MNINWWFVGWWVLLILNVIVGNADYMQGGYGWPVNAAVVVAMVVLRFAR
jgi:hypothetical protein